MNRNALHSDRQSPPARAVQPLVVVLGLLAGLALPLEADVIDDFGGPKKFLSAGLNEVPSFDLDDGEMQLKCPTSDGFGTFWYFKNYELPDGQPVEFRLDIVSLNHGQVYAGLALFFPSPPTSPRDGGRGYDLLWLQGRVILHRIYGTSSYDFFDTSHPHSSEPVTMSLTLTRRGSIMNLATKVYSTGAPEQVVFQRDAEDRPPLLGPVIGIGVQLGALGGAGAEARFDNLVCSADPTPWTLSVQPAAGTDALIQWHSRTILVEANAVEGPWKPWPGVVSSDTEWSRAVIPMSDQAKCYRLVSGEHWLDLFSTTWDNWWQMAPPVPGHPVPSFGLVSGRGRIHGGGSSNTDFLLRPAFGIWPFQDAVASVDIVEWDESMEDAGIGIVLRAKPDKDLWYPRTEGLPHNRYTGLLTLKKAGSPSESVLALTGPGGEPLEIQRFPAVDSARQYRLKFWAVGDRLTLELFTLDSLGNVDQTIAACEASDGRVVEGVDALWGTRSAGQKYDVTIDRYLFTGTTR